MRILALKLFSKASCLAAIASALHIAGIQPASAAPLADPLARKLIAAGSLCSPRPGQPRRSQPFLYLHYTDPHLQIVVERMPIAAIAHALTTETGLRVVYPPEQAAEQVSVCLPDVTVREALSNLFGNHSTALHCKSHRTPSCTFSIFASRTEIEERPMLQPLFRASASTNPDKEHLLQSLRRLLQNTEPDHPLHLTGLKQVLDQTSEVGYLGYWADRALRHPSAQIRTEAFLRLQNADLEIQKLARSQYYQRTLQQFRRHHTELLPILQRLFAERLALVSAARR